MRVDLQPGKRFCLVSKNSSKLFEDFVERVGDLRSHRRSGKNEKQQSPPSPRRKSIAFAKRRLIPAPVARVGSAPSQAPLAVQIPLTERVSIHIPSIQMLDGSMVDNVHQLRPKPNDTEKITINLGFVDLGHIDLMVQDGFYSNRTDFIRTAIRNQLERHADVVKQSTARKSLDLGLRNYSREDLEQRVAPGRCWRSMYWASPLSLRMSLLNLPAPLSLRSSCWERCTPVRRSRPL